MATSMVLAETIKKLSQKEEVAMEICGGRHEIVETLLPAMIAVLREINRPRYPTVPMRLLAEDAAVTMWNNKVMGLRGDTIGLKSPHKTRSHLLEIITQRACFKYLKFV